MKKHFLLKWVYTALCLATALVLPFLTGQIPQIGAMLCPMHIPVLLCGFLCGPAYGAVVGFTAPLLRSFIFFLPPLFPAAVAMAFEMATYGLLAGVLYRTFPKTVPCLYGALLAAMAGGRVVWGAVQFLFSGLFHTGFSFSAFLAGAVTQAVPGILLQILLVPALVLALKRAKLLF